MKGQIMVLAAETLEAQLNPLRARVVANRFILENLADRFSAGEPRLLAFPVRVVWVLPVELTYPNVGVVGQVGFVAVDGEQETVVGWTPFDVMETTAQQLYTSHQDAIEAAFS